MGPFRPAIGRPAAGNFGLIRVAKLQRFAQSCVTNPPAG